VTSELLPGELLDELFERADAAGQSDEGIRAFEHLPLALMHVGRDDHLLDALERVFLELEKVRNDPGDHAAVIEHGARHRAHDAERAAAIDEADAVFGEHLAKRFGGFDEMGIGARAGAALVTDGFDLVHINSCGIAA
jgi:hypothetical protein